MKKIYYIIKYLPSKIKDLPDGPRVIEQSVSNISFSHEVGEGPFNNLNEVKNSAIYKDLTVKNPKRAIRIIVDKYIVKAKNIIIYPDNKSMYSRQIYKLMEHSQNGQISKKDISGIHLYNPQKIQIIKITKPKNSYGIWEAIIKVYNPNSNRWVRKVKPTTFFPDNWDLQKLVFECENAFNNKTSISDKKYHGITKSGIPVVMVLEDDNLKSIYPLYET